MSAHAIRIGQGIRLTGNLAAVAVITHHEHMHATTPKPEMTESQRNAVDSANSYLESQPFSKAGLIKQLSSKYGEGYPKADAAFAAQHIHVDRNEQAVKSAKSYLRDQSFSRQGLTELTSQNGEGSRQVRRRTE